MTAIRALVLTSLVVLGGLARNADLQGQARQGWGPVDSAAFGAFIDAFFVAEMERSHIPGAVFLAVKDGAVFYARGYGVANLETGSPVDPDRTVFRVGSNSKPLTAAAVLALRDEGKVDLDTDVNMYLTRVRVPEANGEPITLRQLLTHTAGLDEWLFGQHAWTREEALGLGDYLARRLPPRTGPPGVVISYNDHGTSLAGLVVEEVSGQPFAEYVADRIFGPLGMTLSSFDVLNLPAPVREHLATGYRYWGGAYRPYAYDYIQTAPAAGLVTTASDMGKFMLALLGGGRLGNQRILSDSGASAMLRRQFAHNPLLPGRSFGFVETAENGVHGFSKDGQATGFLSRIFLLPEADLGFFASINLSIFEPGPSFNRASGFHRRLTTAILDQYFPADSSWDHLPAAPLPDPGFDAGPYVGTYRSMEGSRHTIEKLLFLANETQVWDGGDGTIMVNGMPYVEIRPGTFQYAGGGPYYVAFRPGDDGLASHLFIGGGALERVPWHDTLRTTKIVLCVTGLVCLSAILIWPLASLLARRRAVGGPAEPPGSTARAHAGRWVLVGAAALALTFLIAFGWAFSRADFQEFFKGVPGTIGSLLILPLAIVPLTALACVHSFRAWTHGQGSRLGRIHYSLVSAALIVFLLFLHNWQLLGWRS